MNESGPIDPDQAQDWIDQERERLRREREQTDSSRGEAWIESLREWLKLLRPGAASMFGGSGNDEFAQTLRGLSAAQRGIFDTLTRIPPLGLGATYFEPWTKLQAADADFREVEERFREAVIDVHLQTLDELERRLSGEDAPSSEREIYDLWVECGEAVFARIAHSAEFSQLQGALSNAALHRLRAQQIVLEQIARAFDLPTRSELNSLHRQVRALRQEVATLKNASLVKGQAPRTTAKSARKRATTVSKPAQRKVRKRSR